MTHLIAPPTIEDIDRVIATIEKNRATWKGHADYARFLDVELYCLREIKRAKAFSARDNFLQMTDSSNWPDDLKGDWYRGYAEAMEMLHEAVIEYWPELSATVEPEAAPDIRAEARFLLSRLQEYDPGDFNSERDFHGHVAPAIARLRNALGGDE